MTHQLCMARLLCGRQLQCMMECTCLVGSSEHLLCPKLTLTMMTHAGSWALRSSLVLALAPRHMMWLCCL